MNKLCQLLNIESENELFEKIPSENKLTNRIDERKSKH